MAILAFQKPDKVIMLEADAKFGKFEFRPLEPGFGVTVGNALRRILLSSLEGYAINTIRIAGVEHEFSSVPGVKEDVTNIILNLKQVRLIVRYDEISRLTNSYTAPADADSEYRLLIDRLRAFDKGLHEHIYLENEIIFPRTIAFESKYINR